MQLLLEICVLKVKFKRLNHDVHSRARNIYLVTAQTAQLGGSFFFKKNLAHFYNSQYQKLEGLGLIESAGVPNLRRVTTN